MKLLELFDKSVQIKWEHESEYGGVAVFVIGNVPYRCSVEDSVFDAGQLESESEQGYTNTWEVLFSAEGKSGEDVLTNTGTGNPLLVYATVFECIRQFINKFGSRPISFSANDEGRQRLYTRFIGKFLPGWTIKQSDTIFIALPPHFEWSNE